MGPYPSLAVVTARTPVGRDRAIDVLRIASLIVVITGHGLMALITLDGDSLRLGNLLGLSWYLQLLTWLLQVMPLFFFAGGASSALSYKAGTDWGSWLLGRVQRLYRPVFYYLAFWVVALVILHAVLPFGVYEPVAGISVQLLWFLGVYVLVLACVPLLLRVRSGRDVAMVLVALGVCVAVIDTVRLRGGPGQLGLLNFVLVWLIPAVLGVAYVRRLVPRGAALVLAAAALVIDIGLATIGPYEVSLVTVPGQELSNMTPPSLLLAGHCIVLSALAIAVAPWLNRLASNARVWWFVAVGNSGAMTLYLWHLPALLVVFGVSHMLGHDRSDMAQPGFWLLVIVQMVAFYVVTAALFTLLLPVENLPLPWWD
ncbi:MAG: acyltransferase, partial [Actinomycetes bacterium]